MYDMLRAVFDSAYPFQIKIRKQYEDHRQKRNEGQRDKILSTDFHGLDLDPILSKLVAKTPGFSDPRHCLVFWARPTVAVKRLVKSIQAKLIVTLPSM